MRDPDGRLELLPDSVRRTVHVPLQADCFLHSSVAKALVSAGLLIPFKFDKPQVLSSPRVPFVTQPDEWCYEQLFDAGRLTLDIATTILPHGFELKDGSAWNVVFDGCHPRFCDHLSFVRGASAQWWAMGQFFRHFVYPLLLARGGVLWSDEAFRLYLDGVPAERASNMLGWRRFASRHWISMLRSGRDAPATGLPAGRVHVARPSRSNLYALCDWMLEGLRRPPRPRSAWIDYSQDRVHYTDRASEQKHATVGAWIEALRPDSVLDLGCNTGEFTALALKFARHVVAIDSDRQCVGEVYKRYRQQTVVSPVLADLTDLAAARGWAGVEHQGLVSRLAGRCDLVLALGLIHHFLTTHSIPLDRVVDLLAQLQAAHVIVELIPSNDSRVLQLCQQRSRAALFPDWPAQREAFERRFEDSSAT